MIAVSFFDLRKMENSATGLPVNAAHALEDVERLAGGKTYACHPANAQFMVLTVTDTTAPLAFFSRLV